MNRHSPRVTSVTLRGSLLCSKHQGGSHMDGHLDHLRRRNLRDSTIRQRRYVLLRLARFTGKHPLKVSTNDLRAFVDRLDVAESRATETSHLCSYYKWAHQQGILETDPAADLERPRLQRRLPRPIPDPDLARALGLAEDRVRWFLHLAAYAGLRACEIASLRSENVLLHAEPPLIVVEGKGGKMRPIGIHPELARVLAELPKVGLCFPRRDGRGGQLPPHMISHTANRFLHDLGIPHTLHTLRHWFLTNLYRTTRDLRLVQETGGHATPVSTQIYTWVNPGDAVQAVQSLPPPTAA